ncbi:MAG: hypothetical protein GY696_22220 [Gammaproteobacteria bacterium]|nr:hypothetical protein [Gammaproteobacteria bacterium]
MLGNWGRISLEQIEVSMKARGPPGVALYSDPDPVAIEQRDLFLSYQQGMDQAITHYLNVKWSLFEQGWPDSSQAQHRLRYRGRHTRDP